MKPAFFRHTRTLLIVAVVIGSLVLVTPPAHAAPIIFKAEAHNANSPGNNPMTVGPLTLTLGDAIIVNIAFYGAGTTFTVTDTQGNVFTQAIQSSSASGSGASSAIFTTMATAASSDTVTISSSPAKLEMATMLDYSGVGSFGQTASQQLDSAGSSGTTTVTLTNVATTSWIVEDLFYETGGISGSVSASNGQNQRAAMLTDACNRNGLGFCNSYDLPAPSSGFTLSETYSSNNCNAPGCFLSHTAVELSAGAPGTIQTVTQCFGNCG